MPSKRKHGGYRPGASTHSVCVFLAAAFCLASIPVCSGITVRTKADMRLWQTVDDRQSPLTWAWADGAESASLAFSNQLTRAVWQVRVERAAGEAYGRCELTPSGEALVDATLVQLSGAGDGGGGAAAEVSRETATLAYVSNAQGGPITVRAYGTREWNRVTSSRVVAFAPAWKGESGESGYLVQWALVKGFMVTIW